MAAFTALAIASLVAGTAMQAIGQVKAGNAEKASGQAAKRAADASADLSDYNASIADLQAKDATARGAAEESQFRQRINLMIGSQRAGIAATNVDVGFGSSVDVQGDAAFLGELDALTIRTNAAREAWGYDVQAEDLRKRAEIQRKEGVQLEAAGNERASAGKFAAATSIVGGAGSLLVQRYGFNRRMGAA